MVADIASEIGIPLTLIGKIRSGSGVDVLNAAGKNMVLNRQGYTHA